MDTSGRKRLRTHRNSNSDSEMAGTRGQPGTEKQAQKTGTRKPGVPTADRQTTQLAIELDNVATTHVAKVLQCDEEAVGQISFQKYGSKKFQWRCTMDDMEDEIKNRPSPRQWKVQLLKKCIQMIKAGSMFAFKTDHMPAPQLITALMVRKRAANRFLENGVHDVEPGCIFFGDKNYEYDLGGLSFQYSWMTNPKATLITEKNLPPEQWAEEERKEFYKAMKGKDAFLQVEALNDRRTTRSNPPISYKETLKMERIFEQRAKDELDELKGLLKEQNPEWDSLSEDTKIYYIVENVNERIRVARRIKETVEYESFMKNMEESPRTLRAEEETTAASNSSEPLRHSSRRTGPRRRNSVDVHERTASNLPESLPRSPSRLASSRASSPDIPEKTPQPRPKRRNDGKREVLLPGPTANPKVSTKPDIRAPSSTEEEELVPMDTGDDDDDINLQGGEDDEANDVVTAGNDEVEMEEHNHEDDDKASGSLSDPNDSDGSWRSPNERSDSDSSSESEGEDEGQGERENLMQKAKHGKGGVEGGGNGDEEMEEDDDDDSDAGDPAIKVNSAVPARINVLSAADARNAMNQTLDNALIGTFIIKFDDMRFYNLRSRSSSRQVKSLSNSFTNKLARLAPNNHMIGAISKIDLALATQSSISETNLQTLENECGSLGGINDILVLSLPEHAKVSIFSGTYRHASLKKAISSNPQEGLLWWPVTLYDSAELDRTRDAKLWIASNQHIHQTQLSRSETIKYLGKCIEVANHIHLINDVKNGSVLPEKSHFWGIWAVPWYQRSLVTLLNVAPALGHGLDNHDATEAEKFFHLWERSPFVEEITNYMERLIQQYYLLAGDIPNFAEKLENDDIKGIAGTFPSITVRGRRKCFGGIEGLTRRGILFRNFDTEEREGLLGRIKTIVGRVLSFTTFYYDLCNMEPIATVATEAALLFSYTFMQSIYVTDPDSRRLSIMAAFREGYHPNEEMIQKPTIYHLGFMTDLKGAGIMESPTDGFYLAYYSLMAFIVENLWELMASNPNSSGKTEPWAKELNVGSPLTSQERSLYNQRWNLQGWVGLWRTAQILGFVPYNAKENGLTPVLPLSNHATMQSKQKKIGRNALQKVVFHAMASTNIDADRSVIELAARQAAEFLPSNALDANPLSRGGNEYSTDAVFRETAVRGFGPLNDFLIPGYEDQLWTSWRTHIGTYTMMGGPNYLLEFSSSSLDEIIRSRMKIDFVNCFFHGIGNVPTKSDDTSRDPPKWNTWHSGSHLSFTF